MKKARFLIGLLSLSLTLLISTAFSASTSAGLYCFQLAGCAGQAGCYYFGSASGCTITCSDGTVVYCYYVQPDPCPDCGPCCDPRDPFDREI